MWFTEPVVFVKIQACEPMPSYRKKRKENPFHDKKKNNHSFLLTAVGWLHNLSFSAWVSPKQGARKSHFLSAQRSIRIVIWWHYKSPQPHLLLMSEWKAAAVRAISVCCAQTYETLKGTEEWMNATPTIEETLQGQAADIGFFFLNYGPCHVNTAFVSNC